MANLEHKHSVLRITFEAGMGENGKLKTKSKTYRNVKASATCRPIRSCGNNSLRLFRKSIYHS